MTSEIDESLAFIAFGSAQVLRLSHAIEAKGPRDFDKFFVKGDKDFARQGSANMQRVGEIHAMLGLVERRCDARGIFDRYGWKPSKSSERLANFCWGEAVNASKHPFAFEHD